MRPTTPGALALLLWSGLFPVAATAAQPSASPTTVPADLVLRGGAVYTVDIERSWAEAVAIRDGRIVFVGHDGDVEPFVGRDTEMIELAGRMVLPGFHDSHVHPVSGGVELGQCDLNSATTAEEALARVRRCAESRPEGAWVLGGGFQLPLFPGGVARREALDAVTGRRPAYLTSADGHNAWVNSAALELAGVNAETPDPPAGRIVRDPDGTPAGTLRESAMALVGRHVPPLEPAERVRGLERALEMAGRFGITSWVEASASPEIADAYLTVSDEGRLTVRTLLSLQLGEGDEVTSVDELRRQRERYRGPRLRADSVKVFVDGVIEGGTAALLEPYLDRDGVATEDRGELNHDPARLAALVTELDAAGFQLHAHAIGDRAIRVTLDVLEAAARANGPRDRRHHLAHIQLFDPADVPRFRRLGAIANFQPLWSWADSYMTDLTEPVLGPERSRWLYPIRTLFESGAVIAAGSDWSVTSMSPLLAIETAVTHKDPELDPAVAAVTPAWNPQERVSLPVILAAYTVGGAHLMRQEERVGSIEVGKDADLIVLEENLFEIAPERIGEVRVLLTLLAGEAIHRDPEG